MDTKAAAKFLKVYVLWCTEDEGEQNFFFIIFAVFISPVFHWLDKHITLPNGAL